LGCYEDEKEKYLNFKDDELDEDDEADNYEINDMEEGGDFADEDAEGEFDYEKAIKEAEAYKAMLNSNTTNNTFTNIKSDIEKSDNCKQNK
jgi:hypothetical protein